MGGHVSLHQAVRQKDLESLRTLCARTRDVNVREDVEGLMWTALQLAAWIGNNEAAEILMQSGATVNIFDEAGATALHLAATKGHAATAKMLLDNRASVNAIDTHGMTPLHRAAMEGHDETVKLLCRRLADVNKPDKQGATPLHLACFEGHLICVYLLLEAGASTLVVDHNGNTPLHDAAAGGHQVIMHRLVLHGARVGLRNEKNVTAEMLLDASLSQAVGMDVEDSESTTHGSETMPATPPKFNHPYLAASSSIDACSWSGPSDDDLSIGEVTSNFKGPRDTLITTEPWPDVDDWHFGRAFYRTNIDREPRAPPRDTGFISRQPPKDPGFEREGQPPF